MMKRLFSYLLIAALVSSCVDGAIAQSVPGFSGMGVPVGGSSGGGGGGSGTVTSVATSCGVSGGTITTTGTIQANVAPNAQTGTSYTLANTDCGKFVTFTNASAIAVTIAQAGGGGNFASGWFTTLINEGAGTITITPTTSTIDGAASLTVATNQSIDLYSDGSNYFTARGLSSGGAGAVTTTGSPASGNLTKFSGLTSITNGDLSGDCTTSGTLVETCNAPHPGYLTSNWYTPSGISAIVSAGSVVGANVIRCTYGIVPKTMTVGALGARVSTAVASGNFQLALYTNSAGRPAALISNTGSISTASAASVSGALGANVQIGPSGTGGGRDIWFCVNTDATAGASVTFTAVTSSPMTAAYMGSAALANALSTSSITGVLCSGANCTGASSTFGSWPASLAGSTWSDMTTNIPPIVAMQVVSSP